MASFRTLVSFTVVHVAGSSGARRAGRAYASCGAQSWSCFSFDSYCVLFGHWTGGKTPSLRRVASYLDSRVSAVPFSNERFPHGTASACHASTSTNTTKRPRCGELRDGALCCLIPRKFFSIGDASSALRRVAGRMVRSSDLLYSRFLCIVHEPCRKPPPLRQLLAWGLTG